MRSQTPAEVVAALPVEADPYAAEVVLGVGENLEQIDELLRRFAKNWDLERMPTLDRAVLRMATYELGHRPDVPRNVILNEAVELAKTFSTDDSGRFVNGMLSAVADEVRDPVGGSLRAARLHGCSAHPPWLVGTTPIHATLLPDGQTAPAAVDPSSPGSSPARRVGTMTAGGARPRPGRSVAGGDEGAHYASDPPRGLLRRTSWARPSSPGGNRAVADGPVPSNAWPTAGSTAGLRRAVSPAVPTGTRPRRSRRTSTRSPTMRRIRRGRPAAGSQARYARRRRTSDRATSVGWWLDAGRIVLAGGWPRSAVDDRWWSSSTMAHPRAPTWPRIPAGSRRIRASAAAAGIFDPGPGSTSKSHPVVPRPPHAVDLPDGRIPGWSTGPPAGGDHDPARTCGPSTSRPTGLAPGGACSEARCGPTPPGDLTRLPVPARVPHQARPGERRRPAPTSPAPASITPSGTRPPPGPARLLRAVPAPWGVRTWAGAASGPEAIWCLHLLLTVKWVL